MNQFPQAVLRSCLVGAVVSARRLSLFLLHKNVGMGECRDCILTSSFTTAKLGKNYKITPFMDDKICLHAMFFMLKYCKVLHLWVDCNLDVADWNFCLAQKECQAKRRVRAVACARCVKTSQKSVPPGVCTRVVGTIVGIYV